MSATCMHVFRALITCDGEGLVGNMLAYGPYIEHASALAHITDHGAACTGLGSAVEPLATSTCRARVYDTYEWQDVV